MKKIGRILTVIVLAALAGGAVLLFTKNSTPPPTNNQASQANDGESQLPKALDIVYTGYGFSPDNFGVSPGATITMINESSQNLELASDPYPTSIDNPEMNVGRIASGERKSFKITKVGSWGYHNHLEPGHHGRIAVLRGE